MDRIVRISATGGVDRLEVAGAAADRPGPGQIRLRQDAVGVNFIDVYHRSGLYPLPLPAVLGVEGAGIVEAVGRGVDDLATGDRVAYAGIVGGYASTRLLPRARAIRLPRNLPSDVAAASMLRGITAHMLLTRVHPVGAATTVLVHAAAVGRGAMLTRWASHLGATVIGTASSAANAAIARSLGATHVIVGRDVDPRPELPDLTDGRGVDVAYDGIGGRMLAWTLGCVRPFGTVASIGQAAGPIPPIDPAEIGPRRSLSLVRPSVMAYAACPRSYEAASRDLLAVMAPGVTALIGARHPLEEAASAQADLEAGRTSGSILLMP